jgi:hypothetical protein
MLTPKVTCLSTLPSAHASRGAGGPRLPLLRVPPSTESARTPAARGAPRRLDGGAVPAAKSREPGTGGGLLRLATLWSGTMRGASRRSAGVICRAGGGTI